MNLERLVREIEKRLGSLEEPARAAVLDAVREEISRERRRLDPALTIEAERERRLEAESLREVAEAINRPNRLDDTVQEILKHLSRMLALDSCLLALLEPDGLFRVVAARGLPETGHLAGLRLQNPFTDAIGGDHQPLSVVDLEGEPSFVRPPELLAVRSWAGIPLLVEGDLVGLVSLHRHRVEGFDEEDLHLARALAFTASAAVRKAQMLEQIRRYAVLMERVVEVDQAVFAGRTPPLVAKQILDGALRIGTHRGGLLALGSPGGPRVVVTAGVAAGAEGKTVPAELLTRACVRLEGAAVARVAAALGLELPELGLYVVPFATTDTYLGSLVLVDPDEESADDRLMESYALRTATAYLHSVRNERRA